MDSILSHYASCLLASARNVQYCSKPADFQLQMEPSYVVFQCTRAQSIAASRYSAALTMLPLSTVCRAAVSERHHLTLSEATMRRLIMKWTVLQVITVSLCLMNRQVRLWDISVRVSRNLSPSSSSPWLLLLWNSTNQNPSQFAQLELRWILQITNTFANNSKVNFGVFNEWLHQYTCVYEDPYC